MLLQTQTGRTIELERHQLVASAAFRYDSLLCVCELEREGEGEAEGEGERLTDLHLLSDWTYIVTPLKV